MNVNDLVAIKSMFDTDDMHKGYCDEHYHDRSISGGAATALAAGFAGLGIVIFGGLGLYGYVNAMQRNTALLTQANGQRITDTITAIGQLNQTLLNEANARQTGENAMRNEYTTATNRVVDKIYIVNTTATSANSVASAIANAENTLFTQSILGNINQCPQKVSLYSAPQPCPCPASNCGCGCNG